MVSMKKGIVGIEAAIVLIAFVLVASALAFVALNMGLFSVQKTKEVMGKAYEEATRALEVAGSVLANMTGTDGGSADLNNATAIMVPIKLTAGSRNYDLTKLVVITSITFPNGTAKAYVHNLTKGTVFEDIHADLSDALDSYGPESAGNVSVLGLSGSIEDKSLDPIDIALMVIKLPNGVSAYSRVIIEIQTPYGNTLTIERIVPPTTAEGIINLDTT